MLTFLLQGVYVTLQPDAGGYNKLCKIRFSRQRFSHDSANEWWYENRHWLVQKYSLKGAEREGNDLLPPVSKQPSVATHRWRGLLQHGISRFGSNEGQLLTSQVKENLG